VSDLTTIQGDLAPEATAAEKALVWLRDHFQIIDQTSFDQAGELVKEAKRRWKELDERRAGITKPMLEAQRKTNAFFKPVLDHYAQAEGILKAKIGAYAARVQAERAAAMQRSAVEFQAGGTPTDLIPEPAKTSGVSTSETWVPRIDHPDLVPRDFCSPDLDKINAVAWHADTVRTPPKPIPGVTWVQGFSVRVRT
jgi:hypothetical protein